MLEFALYVTHCLWSHLIMDIAFEWLTIFLLDTCGFLQKVFNNTVAIACSIYTLLKSVNHSSFWRPAPPLSLLSRHLLKIPPPRRARIGWRQALLMSPSIYTSQIILINDESLCVHVSVCPRLVFNLSWVASHSAWENIAHFSSISSSFLSLSELVERKRDA